MSLYDSSGIIGELMGLVRSSHLSSSNRRHLTMHEENVDRYTPSFKLTGLVLIRSEK